MNQPETILIRAKIIERQESAIVVKLEDGFGKAQVVVHKDHIVSDQQLAPVDK